MLDYLKNGFTVIFDANPVSGVFAGSMNGDFISPNATQDTFWDKLFLMLPFPVIVCCSGYPIRDVKCPAPCAHQHFRRVWHGELQCVILPGDQYRSASHPIASIHPAMKLHSQPLRTLVTAIFERAGCDTAEAARVATHLVEANLDRRFAAED